MTVATVRQTKHTTSLTHSLKAVVELAKPITWFPPMWAFACGVVSAGPSDVAISRILLGVIIAGPAVCAASQMVNDWFDRDVDSINEPDRPIPSGRIPGRLGLVIAVAWTFVSLGMSAALGPWGVAATAVALALAWAYSAPPFRFKANGWLGNTAVAVSYEGLAWITGATVALGGAMPNGQIIALAVLYSAGAHGIMTLNDFKSIRGDRRVGIRSLPASLGADRAARVACVIMAVPQVAVIALLVSWNAGIAASVVAALVVIQLLLMRRFLAKPVGRALWYSGVGVPVYVLGMMVAAGGIR